MKKEFCDVYRRAALEHLWDGGRWFRGNRQLQRFSCNAIARACSNRDSWDEEEAYAEWFKPADRDHEDGWFKDKNYSAEAECQEHRCFCLLLMAEIAADL